MNSNLSLENEVLKNYYVKLRITDRFMKKQGSEEKVSWEEDMTIVGVESESSAKLAARLEIVKHWPRNNYRVEILGAEEVK